MTKCNYSLSMYDGKLQHMCISFIVLCSFKNVIYQWFEFPLYSHYALSWSTFFIWHFITRPAWKTVYISKHCYYCRPDLGMNYHAHLIQQGCTLSFWGWTLCVKHTVFSKPCQVIGSFFYFLVPLSSLSNWLHPTQKWLSLTPSHKQNKLTGRMVSNMQMLSHNSDTAQSSAGRHTH